MKEGKRGEKTVASRLYLDSLLLEDLLVLLLETFIDLGTLRGLVTVLSSVVSGSLVGNTVLELLSLLLFASLVELVL